MNWIELTRDTRLERCTTQKCDGQPTWRLEANGVGSDYCSGCKEHIEQADRAGGDGLRATIFGDSSFTLEDGTILKFHGRTLTEIWRMLFDKAASAAPPSGNAGEGTEPVAWYVPDNSAAMTRDRKVAELWHKVGLTVRALYDAAPPQPAPDALRMQKALQWISAQSDCDAGAVQVSDLCLVAKNALSSAPVPSGEGSDVVVGQTRGSS